MFIWERHTQGNRATSVNWFYLANIVHRNIPQQITDPEATSVAVYKKCFG